MKYKLKDGLNAIAISIGEKVYCLTADKFREYDDVVLAMYRDVLIPEHEPKKPKKETIEITEEINNG